MRGLHVLLFTDVEGSTQLTEQLGDQVASQLWAEHDRIARRLLRHWRGREIDKSDGFLLLFTEVDQAVGYALEMHRALAALNPPLPTRAGIHRGAMVARENTADDVALGAKPLELDGVAKAVASRVMALARGGQTLLSAPAREALGAGHWQLQSHGHWRMKGLADPIELFEVAARSQTGHAFLPPADSAKSYRVLRGDEGWMPVAELRHGLPAERDGFVGRGDALAALAERFHDDTRLVSVLGIGGIGKTRLALRYARQWLGDYPGGAWFCDLSSARSLDDIVHAVAQGLDVPLGKADPVQQLGAAIAGRGQCLVILDNFEQVVRHGEATVGQWLERAPQARFLVASREVLGIPGESAFVLEPLSTAEAVRLFEQRARAADSRYAGSATEGHLLPRLVGLLDRLPLAIELAAARIRVLDPQAMLDRMGERFKLLASTGGRHDRQATLRTALDWSWELLSAPEQSTLAQLSVFEGGFTLTAAEAVVRFRHGDTERWVADLIQGLVEKSLVRRDHGERFNLLRCVQEYAGERLQAVPTESTSPVDASAAALARHWHYFAGLDELQATAGRCADIENLVTACRRALTQDLPAATGALVGAWYALRLTGPFRSVLTLVRAIESMPGLARAQAALVDRVAGAALYLLGDVGAAEQRYASSLAHASAPGAELARAQTLCLMAELQMTRGQHDLAREQLAEAHRIAEDLRHALTQMRALYGMGSLELRQMNFDLAQHHFARAMVLARDSGDKRRLGGLHGNLGLVAQLQGLLESAKEQYLQGLLLARDVGDRQWEGNTRCNLGMLLHELGDPAGARSELETALEIAQAIGHRRLEAIALCNLGLAMEALHDISASLALHRRAVVAARAMADRRLAAQSTGYLGLLLARAGTTAEAEHAFDEAFAELEGIDDPATAGLLLCQRASAAASRGDEAARAAWCVKADSLLLSLAPANDSELGRAWALARGSAHLPASPVADRVNCQR